ncbi:hypothetical protein SAMN05446037_102348 [Anaerovirgula multivorans]|uniref:PepSY domain-containing protein n=1 Tax=Anaerovirgula multivorans TaxID=312168 RepID=A0A239HRF8_9FIRM|nr:hypothetical protein [Anaerovirgula multivorans]SNS83902.1 hypothetical protein SAMN05446037_102348 [Anaerovirgula multivorans]
MKKYTKTILVVLLMISIGFNLINYKSLLESQEKIERVNNIIASNVESNIRQSIMYSQELIDTSSPESLHNLERSIGNLTLAFNHWVDLNQSTRNPNERMQRALSSVEMMRNTIGHHLVNQYKTNSNQLMVYDIEMLENVNQQLKRLLLIYHNIEDRLLELKNPVTSDGGLGQIATSIEESSRLYRHSKLPNKHPEYIEYSEAEASAYEKFSFLKDFNIKEEKQQVVIKDGVHYYEFNFFDDQEEAYTVWMDATDGKVKNYEFKRNSTNGKSISQSDAIVIARDFVQRFYSGNMEEEMFYIEQTEQSGPIYSVRFTPIIEDVKIVSDAHIVNVETSSGEILKYTNDFTNTELLKQESNITIEEGIERHKEEYGNMDYNGLAIVRSFYTRYQPKLTYSFRTVQNQQQTMVFIDVDTGMPVYQLYYVYHPIFN